MSAVHLTADTYSDVVLQSKVPVLLDFWAPWCGPCMMLAPVVEEIADEANDSYLVCKVNVNEEPDLADRFSISVIPTLVVMKNGVKTAESSGLRPKDAILSLLK